MLGSTAEVGLRQFGEDYLTRQTICLVGGTNEMQLNMISERVLDMPRELSLDRNVPYGEVRRNAVVRPS